MIAHTDKEFDHDLKKLGDRLAAMAERAAQQIALAMQSLTEKNDDIAREAVKADAAVDRHEIEIDGIAEEILATRTRVGGDLRFVTMALKFVVDVERIGDLAAGVARGALELTRLPPLDPPVDLTKLAALVQRNLHLAIDSFV